MELKGEFLKDRNAYIAAGEPLIFHCHHYNVFLQMSLEETKDYIDIYPILIDSAHEVSFAQFSKHFSEGTYSVDERKKIIEDYFKFCGYGLIDFSEITADGGKIETNSEHYAISWETKFGLRRKDQPGVSFFATGFIAGAIEAIYDLKEGAIDTLQTACLSKGDSACIFHSKKSKGSKKYHPSPSDGLFKNFGDYYPAPENTGIDYSAIRDALTSIPIEGSDEDGLINAFGVLLTRHYANYYALISLRTLMAMEKQFGLDGISIVRELLVEAGHVCAFNTLGGIMMSPEWGGLIKPMIKDRNDWLHGIIACCNALGWGMFEIDSAIEHENTTTFKITNAYESNSFLKSAGKISMPVCYFLDGAMAGVMNLIYHADITQGPTLDENYYNTVFKADGKFISKQVKARTMGHEADFFSVTREE